MDFGEQMKFRGVFINVENETRKNDIEEDKNLYRLFNREVRSKETLCEIPIP